MEGVYIQYVIDRLKKLPGIFYKVRYKILAPCLKQIYYEMIHSII